MDTAPSIVGSRKTSAHRSPQRLARSSLRKLRAAACPQPSPSIDAEFETVVSEQARGYDIPLADVWKGFISGTFRIVDSWHSEARTGLLLEGGRAGERLSLNTVWAEILRHVLCGEAQKRVADVFKCSITTVAWRCSASLQFIGYPQSSCRAPLALMLAAHSASGLALPSAAVRERDAARRVFAVSVPRPDIAALPLLSTAELAVFRMFMEGLPYAEIARARDTSERTIANQLGAVHRKLGESGRAAILARLLKPGPQPR